MKIERKRNSAILKELKQKKKDELTFTAKCKTNQAENTKQIFKIL